MHCAPSPGGSSKLLAKDDLLLLTRRAQSHTLLLFVVHVEEVLQTEMRLSEEPLLLRDL